MELGSAKLSNIFRIVLTGGPCGGKSTALVGMAAAFRNRGLDCVTLPEVATIVKNAGFEYPAAGPHALLHTFEATILSLSLSLEDRMLELAAARQREMATPRACVLLLDRGILDIKAYCPPTLWRDLLRAEGLSDAALLHRYDQVLHLVTAADGAQEFYTLANNAARTEDLACARKMDRAVLDVYQQHPHRIVIPNRGQGIEAKVEEAAGEALTFVEQRLGSEFDLRADELQDSEAGTGLEAAQGPSGDRAASHPHLRGRTHPQHSAAPGSHSHSSRSAATTHSQAAHAARGDAGRERPLA
jgi:predicted ATPase